MKCLTCKYVTHNCVHVKYVGDSLDMECCPDFVAEFYDSCIVPGIDASSSPHQNRNCLSYREIPFERPGILKRLFDRRGDVLSAEAEAEVCHICDEGPLVNHPAVKELTLFTQYERQQLNSESLSLGKK